MDFSIGGEKRFVKAVAWVGVGERTRRFVARLLRGSWEVGIAWGIGSDILVKVLCCKF